jgi:hypothetical protein
MAAPEEVTLGSGSDPDKVSVMTTWWAVPGPVSV